MLFPARLHEEGVRGHLAPRLVGVSFTHGDRRRLPSGERSGGWTLAGLGFPPKYAPAPSREEGGRRQAPPPARPGRPPPRTHPPPGTHRHSGGRAPHARLPRRSRRPETPPPAARPPSAQARAEEGNAAGAVETLFLTEMFPRLPRRRPHSKSCRLTTDIQKTTETRPGRASRPPAGPGRPPSTAPGPHPRFRSPGRTPRATVPNPARRL